MWKFFPILFLPDAHSGSTDIIGSLSFHVSGPHPDPIAQVIHRVRNQPCSAGCSPGVAPPKPLHTIALDMRERSGRRGDHPSSPPSQSAGGTGGAAGPPARAARFSRTFRFSMRRDERTNCEGRLCPGVAPPAPARGLPRTCEEGPGGASGDDKIQRVKADVAFLSLPQSQSAGDRLAAGPPAEAQLLSRPSCYDAKSRIFSLSRQTFVSISLSSARRRHHARSRKRAGKK